MTELQSSDIWLDPTTGVSYTPGDIIPARHTYEGTIYNEPVIRVECSGFPGGWLENNDTGDVVEMPAIEPTGSAFVGPATAAWMWQYRQAQYCKSLAIERINMNDATFEAGLE